MRERKKEWPLLLKKWPPLQKIASQRKTMATFRLISGHLTVLHIMELPAASIN